MTILSPTALRGIVAAQHTSAAAVFLLLSFGCCLLLMVLLLFTPAPMMTFDFCGVGFQFFVCACVFATSGREMLNVSSRKREVRGGREIPQANPQSLVAQFVSGLLLEKQTEWVVGL